jgi:2,3-bisphosphoglycerate-independent phosphoglycerate mutase
VWREGDAAWPTYPPHDWSSQEVGHLMGPEAQPLWDLVRASWPVLEDQAINRSRIAADKKPATSIWLWGQGRPPQMPTLQDRYGLTGAVISAVDLIRGIGKYAGLSPILVPGATGFLDTNYAGKVAAALKVLKDMDLVFVHVEAPDEAGHSGELSLKLKAIEDFDAKVVGPMVAGLKKLGDFRLLVLCDHLTPLALRTHTPEPVPYILYDSRTPGNRPRPYSEAAAQATGVLLDQGADLLPHLLER